MPYTEDDKSKPLQAANQNGEAFAVLSSTLREKLKIIKPFWVSEQKLRARFLLASVIGFTVAEIALSAGIGLGFKLAINAMVSKQVLSFALNGAATVGGLLLANAACSQRQYLTDVLVLNWRGWLTKQFNNAWLKDQSYYKLQQGHEQKQNPDQRIAENIPNVANMTLGLTLGFFRSALTLATFASILWAYSPLMLGGAVSCALVSSVITQRIGKPLQSVITVLQGYEARFRHSLVRIKDNVKSIALSDMAPVEEKTLTDRYNAIDAERRELLKKQRKLNFFTTLSTQSAQIMPIVLAAPEFLYERIKNMNQAIGDLDQARRAYGEVYSALGWFVNGYQLIAEWSTNTNQLVQFSKALQESKLDILEVKPVDNAPPPPPANANTPKPAAAARVMP